MQYITDLHLHSKYSRAVSPKMDLSEMARVGRLKGTDILSAADFTHPLWFEEISNQLTEVTGGLYALMSRSESLTAQYFFLSTEIASIYKQRGKLRRIHNLVFVPSLQTAAKVSQALVKRGCNLSADGRPIIGLSAKELLELVLEIDERNILIPCHVWTPHFGLYGSASGFDSIKESFEELSPYIYGIETGLSSDPEMNWLIPELSSRSILSFSDAHSAPKMGREATVFELSEPTYENIRQAIMRKGGRENRVAYTIEFYPEEGKYHYSGHRNCNVVFTPSETKENNDICPVCGKKLTEGVLVRVGQLADSELSEIVQVKKNEQGLQWFTDSSKNHPPYVKLIPLLEICAESLSSTVSSQKSNDLFLTLCQKFGNEMTVLLKTPVEEIAKVGGEKVAEGITLVRGGNVYISPGYDGVYGKVAIWKEKKAGAEDKSKNSQLALEL